MKIPLDWLKEYVAVRLSPKALAERLTMAGLEVVGIEEAGGQPVLDLEVTPNRADCLSIIGVAREVAAVTGQRLKLPLAEGSGLRARGKSRKPRAQSPEPRAKLTIRIEDHTGCQRYIGRLLTGVRVGPSPDWMQRRLLACGARPINNVVDITNYVLFEYGQPLHAFDFDRLTEGTILVRHARPQEPLTTLDGVRRALASEMLVIADARQPVAVAGVMGGAGSEVTQATTSVLLESALFDPVTVRRTARALGLASESSYRFERGVDPAGVEAASARATALVRELAGGIEATSADVGKPSVPPAAIPLDAGRASRWLGVRLDFPTVRTTLARLGCRVASSGGAPLMQVRPPSFRRDLRQEVDLYEELARLHGYDHLPATLPGAGPVAPASEHGGTYERSLAVKRLCAGLGLQEVVTWSLVSEAEMARCGLAADDGIRLANPLSQDHARLRPTVVIGLLSAVRRNVSQGAPSIRLFEVGRVFKPADHVESLVLGCALSGLWRHSWQASEPSDFFRLKGLIETLVSRIAEGVLSVAPAAPPWAQRGQAAEFRLDGTPLGVAGAVSPSVRAAWDLEPDVWMAELSVETLLARSREAAAASVPVDVPPVKRDLSALFDAAVTFEAIQQALRDAGGLLAVRIELIDRYAGPQVPAGKTSLTFAIEYRDPSRTLTAAEADALHRRLGDTLKERFGASLR